MAGEDKKVELPRHFCRGRLTPACLPGEWGWETLLAALGDSCSQIIWGSLGKENPPRKRKERKTLEAGHSLPTVAVTSCPGQDTGKTFLCPALEEKKRREELSHTPEEGGGGQEDICRFFQ